MVVFKWHDGNERVKLIEKGAWLPHSLRRRKQKDFGIVNFGFVSVVFKWHDGSKRVKLILKGAFAKKKTKNKKTLGL